MMTVPVSPRILGLGTVTIDHVMTVSAHPLRDTKNEALDSHYQVGGPVPIALAQLTRFGYRPHFLGEWGNDAWGHVIEQRLQDEGISFSTLSPQQFATSVTQIWLEKETGARTLVTARTPGDSLAQLVTKELLTQFHVLHLDGWPTDAAFKAARLMKEQGGIVSLDTGSPKPGVKELLAYVDVVNCPLRFCTGFLGLSDLRGSAQTVLSYGPQLATVTNGEQGAAIATREDCLVQPAMKLDRVVDTNGAGDSFSGALLHGFLKQWTPEKILSFAVVCSGLKCKKTGNSFALPNESEVMQAMSQWNDMERY